jgi:hypothetical protein
VIPAKVALAEAMTAAAVALMKPAV